MEKLIFDGEYFNVKDTLECGQIFRFFSTEGGAYFVSSGKRRCLAYNQGDKAVVECQAEDKAYFTEFFDLSRDYGKIVGAAENFGGVLAKAATLGKGVRILNQDKTETLYSFIVSQNNNIPRIKGIIERLCRGAGEKREFYGEEYYAFPDYAALAAKPAEFFTEIGLGYRADYIKRLSDCFTDTFNGEELVALNTKDLKKRLLGIYGVGPKVADCVSLFGFHRSDSFPVDTWIEKVYKENFEGTLTDRNKIAEDFVGRFGENAGYFQQYLFYYKRSLEKD